jgi:hypothetical protein
MVLVMTNSVVSLAHRLNSKLQTYFGTVQSFLVSSDSDEELQYLVNAFEMGRDVDFGALVLSKEGICTPDDIIPWGALRSFCYSNRELVFVRQCGNQFSSHRQPASKLKHIPILLHILHQHSPEKASTLSH